MIVDIQLWSVYYLFYYEIVTLDTLFCLFCQCRIIM